MKLFLSHAWDVDEAGRSCHARVKDIATRLRVHGYDVWLDDDELMHGHIDAAMAQGIEHCDVFIAFLTRAYCVKVQAGLCDATRRDNCAKEWNCAMSRHKRIVPVLMDASMRCTEHWPMSAVTLHIAGHMYADACGEDLRGAVARLHAMLSDIANRPPRRLPSIGARATLPPLRAATMGAALPPLAWNDEPTPMCGALFRRKRRRS